MNFSAIDGYSRVFGLVVGSQEPLAIAKANASCAATTSPMARGLPWLAMWGIFVRNGTQGLRPGL